MDGNGDDLLRIQDAGTTRVELHKDGTFQGLTSTSFVKSGGTSSQFLMADGSVSTGGGTATTINNNANNRIITGSDTADTLEAESGLTFDGNDLTIVASGTTTKRLYISSDTDYGRAYIGRAHVGKLGFDDHGGFSHIDHNTQTNYAILQNSSGKTFLNAASGQEVNYRINNSTIGKHNASGIYFPIYYDYNDTNYYVNPASTTKLNTVHASGNLILDDGTGASPTLEFKNENDNRVQFYADSNGDLILTRVGSGGAEFQFHTHATDYTNAELYVGGGVVTATKIGQWNTAYGWGNHASAGYITQTNADARYVLETGGSSSAMTGDLHIIAGSPKIYLQDNTDDDDQQIIFRNNGGSDEYRIATQDFTPSGGGGDGFYIGSTTSDGELALVTANTTALTLDTSQNANFAGDVNVGGLRIVGDNDSTDQGTAWIRSNGNYIVINPVDGEHLYLNWDTGASGGSGHVKAAGAMYATQFFDRNDTNYYLDPASTSVVNHMDMDSGNTSGKFAVKSSAVHGSYDFYNNGTSYFNGSVTVNAPLYVQDYIYHEGDTDTYLYFTSDNIKLRTGGDDRLELSASGAFL